MNCAHKLLEIYYGYMYAKDSGLLEACLRVGFSSRGYYFIMAHTGNMFDVKLLNTIEVDFSSSRFLNKHR